MGRRYSLEGVEGVGASPGTVLCWGGGGVTALFYGVYRNELGWGWGEGGLSFCIMSSSALHGGVSFFVIPLGFSCSSWFSITPI